MTGTPRRADILGTWELASYDVRDDEDRVITLPLGGHPLGFLIYTDDGFMSAQLGRRDLETGYLAYSGRFDIDEATGVLHHHVAVSLRADWTGGDQVRHGTLDHGSLVLTGEVADEFGAGAVAVLTWHRPD
jgi:hypothetical protein